MKTTNKTRVEETMALEAVENRELETVDGGLNGTPAIPSFARGPGPRPMPPAPFRDLFVKYTIGPI